MATASILVPPLDYWPDATGAPLMGGTIDTFQPGTSTKALTWQDSDMSTANTNPIVLNALGMAQIYGNGAYRFVVKDALGNQIYDALTSAYLPLSDVGTFILPALAAPDGNTFLSLSGVTAQLNAAIAAVELLGGPTGPTGATGASGAIGPTGPSGDAFAPTYVFSGGPPSQGFLRFGPVGSAMIQFGTNVTDGSGNCTVTFPTPFVGAIASFGATASTGDPAWFCTVNNPNNVFMTVATGSPKHGGGWPGPLGFSWFAIGS